MRLDVSGKHIAAYGMNQRRPCLFQDEGRAPPSRMLKSGERYGPRKLELKKAVGPGWFTLIDKQSSVGSHVP